MSETRLCRCGCLQSLTRKKREGHDDFKRRQFVDLSHKRSHEAANRKPKRCEHCNELFSPNVFGSNLESISRYRKRRFCSHECAAEAQRKPKTVKVIVKPPTASPSRPRAAARPKAAPKPKPTPVKPQTASQRVFTGLPDPRLHASPTIAPALPAEDRPVCPKHPHVTLTSFGCSNCQIENRSQNRSAKPYVITPVWRRQNAV